MPLAAGSRAGTAGGREPPRNRRLHPLVGREEIVQSCAVGGNAQVLHLVVSSLVRVEDRNESDRQVTAGGDDDRIPATKEIATAGDRSGESVAVTVTEVGGTQKGRFFHRRA